MMANQTSVSIILPVYNGADTIEKSIYSILYQSHQNIQLIIVDDCSTDNTVAIVQAISDERIQIIKMHENAGVYHCRNTGLQHANGDLITFQDADDLSDPYRIQKCVAILNSIPEIQMVYGQYIRYTQDYAIVKRDNYNCLVTMMFRKSVINDVGYFDCVRAAGDSEFFERLHKQFGQSKIYKIHELLYYALESDGITQQFALSGPSRLNYKKDFQQWHKSAASLYLPLPTETRAFALRDERILAKQVKIGSSVITERLPEEGGEQYKRTDFLIEVDRINQSWTEFVRYMQRDLLYKLNKTFNSLVNLILMKFKR